MRINSLSRNVLTAINPLDHYYILFYIVLIMAKLKTPGKRRGRAASDAGRLKIGDNWNAITIIALSQNNPLKAIAEFVENSIDARADHITIVRGKEAGEYYLKIIDNGEGIRPNAEGTPDFKYVATHICDSIKKRLKKQGEKDIQGEFGIGLLSFWTVGKMLTLTSAGSDGRLYQMCMKKNEPGYEIKIKRSLLPHEGTELVIHPLLAGIRQLHGEKIQNYLASELRDRIRVTDVKIRIKDRVSRKEYEVEPRQFSGILLHELPPITVNGREIYCELYLNSYNAENTVSLYRHGTRVLGDIAVLDMLHKEPWTENYLQGILDVPFLNLTPGTRDGIIQDDQFQRLCRALEPLEAGLKETIAREKKAAEEKASRDILKSVQKAFKEALLALPREEYNWFDIYGRGRGPGVKTAHGDSPFADNGTSGAQEIAEGQKQPELNLPGEPGEKKFFEYAGPLYKAVVSPASCIIKVGEHKHLRVIARDRGGRQVENIHEIIWQIKEGQGQLSDRDKEVVTFNATPEPGISIVSVTVKQNLTSCTAEAVITVTDSLIQKDEKNDSGLSKGMPGYTFKRAPGELWRSSYDKEHNLIIINNAHADYLYASRTRSRKVKYICKLFVKELVLHNFLGFNKEQALERMVELSLYTEENLK